MTEKTKEIRTESSRATSSVLKHKAPEKQAKKNLEPEEKHTVLQNLDDVSAIEGVKCAPFGSGGGGGGGV
tara:strand:- start:49 stop:258 length:210 start_codon:yes stop_codon:yes gene_type:complete